MLHEGYFDKIYYRFWKADNSVANIFAIHGLGGHSLWFDKVALVFNANNINFFSYDLPGFGQSKYERGKIKSYKDWVIITQEVLKQYLVTYLVQAPVFILGYSMGALISVLLATAVKAHGWILAVPGFGGHNKSWPAEFMLPLLFKSIFSPDKKVILPFGPELLVRNSDLQLDMKRDPFRVINPCSSLFMQLYLMTLKAKQNPAVFSAPVLMLQAGKDMVCSNKAMKDYFERIKVEDKVRKTFVNSYHDLLLDNEAKDAANFTSGWIKDRI